MNVHINTAKLAKTKNYNEKVIKYFMGSGKTYTWDMPTNGNNSDFTKEIYSCPDQHELAAWLRENKDIHVEIYSNMSGWGWILTKTNGTTIKEITDSEFYNTYEDAMEFGLIEALNLL